MGKGGEGIGEGARGKEGKGGQEGGRGKREGREWKGRGKTLWICSPRKNFLATPLSVIHERGSDNPFQRYGYSKFSKMAGGRILDLVQPEIGPFDPPSPKTLPTNTKWIG